MAKLNPLRVVSDLGQSVWLDHIERGFVRGGGLARLIAEDELRGVTSNPSIFQRGIVEHHTYDQQINALTRQGLAAHEVHEALIIDDIRDAADVLEPVYARTAGRDGFVSLEVSPHLAHDTEGTYWEAKRLATLVDRRNVMIKVPGTMEGVAAVRSLIADGINVNVTLRLLWASTSTKDRAYSDTKYVDALVRPQTVTTLPPETLAAYRDHGQPMLRRPADDGVIGGMSASDLVQRLAAEDIDGNAVTAQLEKEGVNKFAEAHDATLQVLRERIGPRRSR